MLITRAMSPSQYTEKPHLFHERKNKINPILSLSGMEVRDNGKVCWVKQAKTLDEARARADHLQRELSNRRVHEDILKFCKPELVQSNYFHAVFEAMKSVAEKIRALSDLNTDGSQLVDDAFSLGREINPVLAINKLISVSEQSEQKGFCNILRGLFSAVRNPLGHEAKINWVMSEQDALDILTTLSFVQAQREPGYKK